MNALPWLTSISRCFLTGSTHKGYNGVTSTMNPKSLVQTLWRQVSRGSVLFSILILKNLDWSQSELTDYLNTKLQQVAKAEELFLCNFHGNRLWANV